MKKVNDEIVWMVLTVVFFILFAIDDGKTLEKIIIKFVNRKS